MNFVKKLVVIIALGALAMPISGYAQYHFDCDPFFSYFKDSKRWEIGFGVVAPFGEFNGVTRVNTNSGSPVFLGDTTMKRKMMAQPGFGASIGLFAPFKGTGHISYWGMDASLMVNEFIWQNLNQTYSPDGSFHDNTIKSVNALTIQIGMPLGVSYKVGCDAILSRRLALCAAFGAGIIPQVNYTNIEGVSGFNDGYGWSVTPYVKMDLGFMAGWCWKFRFMYTYGHINLFDADHAITANNLTDGPFNIATTSNLYVSLIINPFTSRWPETGWWNTHDTYNQHDRFN